MNPLNILPECPVPDDFQCARCGACCEWEGNVKVTEEEISKIAEFVGLGRDEFMDRYVRLTHDRKGLSLTDREDNGHCIFYLNTPPDGPRCIIQEVKPTQCKGFPFEWKFRGWENACGAMKKGKE